MHPQQRRLSDPTEFSILDELAGGVGFVLILVGAFLALHLGDARAETRLEALGGECQYTEVGDGIWQNSKYPHALDMRDACALLAVSSITPHAGAMATGWRLAYVTLGKARVDAVFPMVDHEQALPAFNGAACNSSTMSGCLGHGRGFQSARGLSLGYVLEDTVGPIVLGLDVGAFVYEGTFSIAIEREPRSTAARWVDFHWTGWQATPYYGANIRYGYLMAMFRVYGRIRAAEHGCGGCSGVANGSGTQVAVGLSVPF